MELIMSAKQSHLIPSYSALQKGADLWVVSDPEHSLWNAKIDWYLHFQLRTYRRWKINPAYKKKWDQMLQSYNMPLFHWEAPASKALLIESSHYLPNLWTLELAYSPEWLNEVYKIWMSLNQPSLRVFAPKIFSKKTWEDNWSQISKKIATEYVLEHSFFEY